MKFYKAQRTKIIAIILAIALIIAIAFISIEIFRTRSTTTVGEVVYVNYFFSDESEPFEDRVFAYDVYIKPLGNAENQDWIHLLIDENTITQSKKNTDISQMPELAIGAIVEVVRNAEINKPKNNSSAPLFSAFYAESIKLVENYSDEIDSTAVSLVKNKKYEPNLIEGAPMTDGTLVGVIPVNQPIQGYIVYVRTDETNKLQKFWIDESTRLDFDNEIKSTIEAGITGVRVSVTPTTATPFSGANKHVYSLHLIYKNEPQD